MAQPPTYCPPQTQATEPPWALVSLFTQTQEGRGLHVSMQWYSHVKDSQAGSQKVPEAAAQADTTDTGRPKPPAAALVTTAQRWKPSECLGMDEGVNKCGVSTQWNALQPLKGTKLTCATMWMKPQEYANEDFPGGTVDKNPSASAGDKGSSPGPGRIFHMQLTKPAHARAHTRQLLSLRMASAETCVPGACAPQEPPPQ